MQLVPYKMPTVLEGLVNAAITLWFLLGTCDLFLCNEKTAVIMLKILGATVQNVVGWATKCLGYMEPCCGSSVAAMWFPSEYHMFLYDMYTK
jgi:hypothetical protein